MFWLENKKIIFSYALLSGGLLSTKISWASRPIYSLLTVNTYMNILTNSQQMKCSISTGSAMFVSPFMPNGFSNLYQLDEFIYNFRVVSGIFHFYSNFNRTFCKQTVETLIRRHVMWRLTWVCTVCLCPTKRKLGLYGLR